LLPFKTLYIIMIKILYSEITLKNIQIYIYFQKYTFWDNECLNKIHSLDSELIAKMFNNGNIS